jgi:hypothetical protein
VFVPRPVLGGILLLVLLFGGWNAAVLADRNPFPFPDRRFQVFNATTPAAMEAVTELFRLHGNPPRYRADSDRTRRAVFRDGTVLNQVDPPLLEQLGSPAAAIGFVVRDPVVGALDAARLLRARGFTATVIEGAEPGLPVTFVATDALAGSVLVFRRHQLRSHHRAIARGDRLHPSP